MASLYDSLCGRLGWARSESDVAQMGSARAAQDAALESSIEEAKAQHGDEEVFERSKARAEALLVRGDKVCCRVAF